MQDVHVLRKRGDPLQRSQFGREKLPIVEFRPLGDGFYFVGSGFAFQSPDPFEIFAIQAIASGGCLGTDIYGSATPCSAGDLIDQSLHTPGVIDLGTGSATLDGTTYSDVSFSGELTFSATAAPLPASSADVIVLAAPFVFNGMLRGFSNGQELFSVDLTGTGITERAFFRIAAGVGAPLRK